MERGGESISSDLIGQLYERMGCRESYTDCLLQVGWLFEWDAGGLCNGISYGIYQISSPSC